MKLSTPCMLFILATGAYAAPIPGETFPPWVDGQIVMGAQDATVTLTPTSLAVAFAPPGPPLAEPFCILSRRPLLHPESTPQTRYYLYCPVTVTLAIPEWGGFITLGYLSQARSAESVTLRLYEDGSVGVLPTDALQRWLLSGSAAFETFWRSAGEAQARDLLLLPAPAVPTLAAPTGWGALKEAR